MADQVTTTGQGEVADATFRVTGFQQIEVADDAVSTLTIPEGTEHAFIQVDDQNIRYRDDGTVDSADPTATVGLHINAGGQGEAYPGPLAAFRMIAETGTAKVNISYRAETNPS